MVGDRVSKLTTTADFLFLFRWTKRLCLGGIRSVRWWKVRRNSVQWIFDLCRFAPRELAWNFHCVHHRGGRHHTYRQHRCQRRFDGIRVKPELVWLDSFFYSVLVFLDLWICHGCLQHIHIYTCCCIPFNSMSCVRRELSPEGYEVDHRELFLIWPARRVE